LNNIDLNLLNIDNGTYFRITKIDAETDSRHRLNSMGIHVNDNYFKRGGNGKGPVIIQNHSNHATQIAIGRDLAETVKIVVLAE
jgi:Fe2+ transport system protein FeoA